MIVTLAWISDALSGHPLQLVPICLAGMIGAFMLRQVALALVALVAPRETLSFADGVVSIRGIAIAVEDVDYTYEDEDGIIIQAKDKIPGILLLGYCYKFRRRIFFHKLCIRNTKELSDLIKSIPAPRRQFLPSRSLYYFMAVLAACLG